MKKEAGAGFAVRPLSLPSCAAFVLTGLVAESETEVHRVDHIDRGYERLERHLSNLGAHITREYDDEGV